ncbi:hypothetical protein OUZ56_026687 [Daphnia magna]|uniref:Uncharacterized protein n=1 Tax=Daphnia magna TaxID=35525 RepID=A0ABQ9ZMJ6_9CRUS|nr:hypothetical protein OUZ56_026687 [Daphnia magna]
MACPGPSLVRLRRLPLLVPCSSQYGPPTAGVGRLGDKHRSRPLHPKIRTEVMFLWGPGQSTCQLPFAVDCLLLFQMLIALHCNDNLKY